MNKIVKDKKSLILMSGLITLISLALLIASIAFIVVGVKMLNKSMVLGIILIVACSILALIFLIGIICGLVMNITGKAVVAYNGSIAEDNLAIGTVNMIKCKTCGAEVNKNDKFCKTCGKSLADVKTCAKCNTEVEVDAKVCPQCGEKF